MKPILQALVVADHVYSDKTTGKKIIAGTFNRIFVGKTDAKIEQRPDGMKFAAVPGGTKMGTPSAYLNLTNIHNQADLAMRYVFLADNTVRFSAKINVTARSPLDSVEMVLPLPELPREPAGAYALEVLWNDENIGSHRIFVEEIKPGPPPETS